MPVEQFSARWTGVYKADKDGTVKFQLAGDDGYRLFVNDKLSIAKMIDKGTKTIVEQNKN